MAGHEQIPYIATGNLEADVCLCSKEWSHDVTTCVLSVPSEKRGQRVDGHAKSVVGRVCSSAAADR